MQPLAGGSTLATGSTYKHLYQPCAVNFLTWFCRCKCAGALAKSAKAEPPPARRRTWQRVRQRAKAVAMYVCYVVIAAACLALVRLAYLDGQARQGRAKAAGRSM